jgi:hypothetical protein
MVNILRNGIMAVSLALAAALPAFAQPQLTPSVGPNQQLESRQLYEERMSEHLTLWAQRVAAAPAMVEDPDARAKVDRNQLNSLWQEVQINWEVLQQAEQAGWRRAKDALERSLANLELAYDQLRAKTDG